MLKARSIHKSYGQLQILKGVDLEVQKGEIVTIVGASGAGKSSLLNILGTLDRPDSGTLTINDIELNKLNNKQLSDFRNRQIGFIFQFHHLLAEFSALENVCIPAFIAGKSKSEAEKKAAGLLDLLGLKDRLHHKPNQLSGGEQQRVAVARALINNPALIFADEPSGNLDSVNALELHELFIKLKNDFRQTFVIVTHNEDLANLSDRTVTMRDGLIVNGQ
ncbi:MULTISPECIES: ABC transporter ATP-binding protein [Mucilaginibacter]|uniref:ABC transporter ATP-binding protein n=1 Tax=Mucilaginibacter rubeus TaxID=2027860 RepID=A0AAE6JGF7_9SPHI|nr:MULTISPECIES: ABC transporter ATP-binding protein [Mucilaginibacter]QEM05204.1 ABC transporter ATP-binding protein [Mucilaginibacter rubeus]QEM17798.1 ABC transporter ATP-binding protein [Mucilaginibacter gossypii]QTE37311.1 ABC transporter ATP-binding protein [Mucilaginibacter gossypii]QTE45675.1 ABC transporter ATP-binding protein [Mucilaginibacter rubeus]QTE52272.1 ABC transporter ATP-binding protein [Mucilaginibacter rubeus]